MELHCSRDLALRLGAVAPDTIAHHRELKNTCLMVRDAVVPAPLYWPWAMSRIERLTTTAWPPTSS